MTDTAIRVEHLSKRYRIGRREGYKTLRDTLTHAFTFPFRRLRLTGDGRRKTEDLPPVPRPPSPVPSHSSPVASQDDCIWALEDVNLEIKRGEVVGIIGRNGAGKTTLLKILSRITEPTEGHVEIQGRVGSLLEVGTGFHPELTGRENIYLNGAILGMKKAEIDGRFDEIVAFSEVEKFIDTPVKHYSSGMYVRLAFAVAAHLEPEILLVDEVLAVGDVAFQRKCLDKMEGVSREGRTVVFVSHNMTAVTSLCQRGILLTKGQILMDDSADKTVARYLSTIREHQLPVGGKISLVEHPGRRKKQEGLVRLVHCRLLNKDQQPATFFRSGDEARVVIGYEMTTLIKNAHLVFVITFNDILQRRVFSCSNELVGFEFKDLGQEGEVQCVIPKLPLVPGNYTINISCKVGGVWSDGVYESVEFEVLSGEFYDTGRLPPEGSGSVLVEHYWSGHLEAEYPQDLALESRAEL